MDSKIKNLKSKKTKVEKKTIMERIEMLSDLEKKALKKLCKFQILNNTPVKLFLSRTSLERDWIFFSTPLY
jgi:hypothetical protein